MKRFGFKMQLKPGCEQEYERRHAAIWPELVEMIHAAGVKNYSGLLPLPSSSVPITRTPFTRIIRKKRMPRTTAS